MDLNNVLRDIGCNDIIYMVQNVALAVEMYSKKMQE